MFSSRMNSKLVTIPVGLSPSWRLIATSDTWYTASGIGYTSFHSVCFFESTDCSGIDRCLGATASASSVQSGYPASLANDNDLNTRWITNSAGAGVPTNPRYQWIRFNMPTNYTIKSVALYTRVTPAHAKTYDLQYLNSSSVWVTKGSFSTSNTGVLGFQYFNNL